MPKFDIDDTQVQADTIRFMIEKEAKRIAKGKSTWPGLPVSHIPLIWRTAFRPMLHSGEVELVEVPSTTRPASPTSTYGSPPRGDRQLNSEVEAVRCPPVVADGRIGHCRRGCG